MENTNIEIEKEIIETYWNKCTYSFNINIISNKIKEENQIKEEKEEKEDNESNKSIILPPWSLEYIESKGYLAISNYFYKKGDLILKELPLTYCEGWHPFNNEQIENINKSINLLESNEKKAFYQMANVFHEYDLCAGIYMTNSFDMVGAEVQSCGMYLAIARLNHSCIPNAQQSHLPETKEEVLHASRDIQIGEEINDCYIELRLSTPERRKLLQEIYRFHCECPACLDYDQFQLSKLSTLSLSSSTSSSSSFLLQRLSLNSLSFSSSTTLLLNTLSTYPNDAARQLAFILDNKILSLAEDGENLSDILILCEDLLTLLLSPLCDGWKERFLSETYLTMYHLNLNLSKEEQNKFVNSSSRLNGKSKHKKKNINSNQSLEEKKYYECAIKCLKEAHRWNVLLQGENSPDSQNTRNYLDLHNVND